MGYGHIQAAAFSTWWEKCGGGEKFDDTNEQHVKAKTAFLAGFERGWAEASTYDSKWDAD